MHLTFSYFQLNNAHDFLLDLQITNIEVKIDQDNPFSS